MKTFTKEKLAEAIVAAAQHTDYNKSISVVQDFIGSESGDWASQYFSGQDDKGREVEEYWPAISVQERIEQLTEYAEFEHSCGTFSYVCMELERLGFVETDTGGGCEAMAKDIGNGLNLLCTDADSPSLPGDFHAVALTLLTDTHSEEIMQKVFKTGRELAEFLALC